MTKESYNFGVDTEAKRLYTETSGMTEKRFEVTFNDSDFSLRDNETFEEFKLFDEKVCYDYIANEWNALHEENMKLKDENKQLKERNKKLYTEIFEMRTNIALERTEINRETYTAKKSAKEFLDDLEKW